MADSFKIFLGYGLLDTSTNELVKHEITGTHSMCFTFTTRVSHATCVSLKDIKALKALQASAFINYKIVRIYKTQKSYIFL